MLGSPIDARPQTATADDTLGVLVYNVHAGMDPAGNDNLARVARVIRENRVDIALLQEVDRHTERSGGVDQVGRLGWLTALYDTFGKTLDFQGGQYGIAALTSRPPTAHALHPLLVRPAPERAGGSGEPRAVLHLSLPTSAGSIHIVNTHLDPAPAGDSRLHEMTGLLELAESLAEFGWPVLIGGDFNAEPEAAVVEKLRSAGWVDAWARCGAGPGDTYPASGPLKRIDYLFLPADVVCVLAEVLPVEASDHRPLLVTVVIPHH